LTNVGSKAINAIATHKNKSGLKTKNPNFRIIEAENPESQQENKRDRLTTLNVSTRHIN